MRLLAGDIGGTNTRLMAAEYISGNLNILHESSYNSQDYISLLHIIYDFYLQLGAEQQSFDAACFAVAGPVRDQCAKITNLPWYLEAPVLSETLGIRKCSLINDFEAVGISLEILNADDFIILQEGEPVDKGVRLLVGAGTGFGVAMQIWQGGQYVTLPSEAGHTDFAPRDELQIELLAYLKQQSKQVCIEKVLSGDGLVRIYEFLFERELSSREPSDEGLSIQGLSIQKKSEPDAEIIRAKTRGNAASLISQRALENNNSIEGRALDCFVRVYAAQTANLALATMAIGGVYIAGGIAPKIREYLEEKVFNEVFCENPKMSSLLKQFQLSMVVNPNPGLIGAMHCAKQLVV